MQSFQAVVCKVFRRDLLLGVHNFSPVSGDQFKLALYNSLSVIGEDSVGYSPVGEISGSGYSAGGIVIVPTEPHLNSLGQGIVSFASVTFPTANFTCRRALIYNATAPAMNAVGVIDFGVDQNPVNVNFTINMPPSLGPNPFITIR